MSELEALAKYAERKGLGFSVFPTKRPEGPRWQVSLSSTQSLNGWIVEIDKTIEGAAEKINARRRSVRDLW